MSDINSMIQQVRESGLSQQQKDEIIRRIVNDGPGFDVVGAIASGQPPSPTLQIGTPTEQSTPPRQSRDVRILVAIGIVNTILLSLIAFLLFWYSPEMTGQRIAARLNEIATETALESEAVMIASSMRILKSAGIMAIASMPDRSGSLHIDEVIPFLDDVSQINGGIERYRTMQHGGTWYICRSMDDVPRNVKEKLAGMAVRLQLLQDVNGSLYTQNGAELFVRFYTK